MYYTQNVLNFIRSCYYSNIKPDIEPVDIAIHIRRGDVDKGNRYTDNAFYKDKIHQLKTKYPSYQIAIFSEGEYEEFKDLGIKESECFLNKDVFETFHHLVCAKILVLSKSSFSYCAGLLNTNTIYYTYFWHNPLDHWKILNNL